MTVTCAGLMCWSVLTQSTEATQLLLFTRSFHRIDGAAVL